MLPFFEAAPDPQMLPLSWVLIIVSATDMKILMILWFPSSRLETGESR
jgi:hypothetical protein